MKPPFLLDTSTFFEGQKSSDTSPCRWAFGSWHLQRHPYVALGAAVWQGAPWSRLVERHVYVDWKMQVKSKENHGIYILNIYSIGSCVAAIWWIDQKAISYKDWSNPTAWYSSLRRSLLWCWPEWNNVTAIGRGCLFVGLLRPSKMEVHTPGKGMCRRHIKQATLEKERKTNMSVCTCMYHEAKFTQSTRRLSRILCSHFQF